MIERREYRLTGILQGVGFRPHAARLASQYAITGLVGNDDRQVFVEVQGERFEIESYVAELIASLPLMARVFAQQIETLPLAQGESGFYIVASRQNPGIRTPIPSDMATCDDCLAEMADPGDRRHGYAFTTCTNCGPRFTIIQDLPYDRDTTTMRVFDMCPTCRAEYTDPVNRRYHAQPISCFDCGPSLWVGDTQTVSLTAPTGARSKDRQAAAIAEARARLRAGGVLAVKGLGGFHLMCDARNDAAVAALRDRKRRPHKPFAVMVRDLGEARRLARLSAEQERALRSAERPILIAPMAPSYDLSRSIAPGLTEVGIMLPYAPIHTLLLEDGDLTLVATSGNLSEEPICYTNEEAVSRLGRVANGFLLHDRDIHVPVEDSVFLAKQDGGFVPSRRSRGFAPLPVLLPGPPAPEAILAVGGEFKNTFALTIRDLTFVSAHLGDMGSVAARAAFEASVAQLIEVNRARPALIACDVHPGYATTQWARTYVASHEPARLVQVQHHYAHALSLLAEHPGCSGPAVVATLDGTGYGTDGTIWGGEILLVDTRPEAAQPWRRLWHLPTFPLVGGDSAVRQPWRVARGLVHAWDLDLDRVPAPPTVGSDRVRQVDRLLEAGFPITHTSSAGRVFDAVSAILGVRHEATHEAQAASEVEALATSWAASTDAREVAADLALCSEWDLSGGAGPAVRDVLALLLAEQCGVGRRAWRFHMRLAWVLASELIGQARAAGTRTVGITGGVALNRLLVARLAAVLGESGFQLLTHQRLPPSDGGLCVGQAWAAILGAGSSEASSPTAQSAPPATAPRDS